jgi:hypothetical protein
VTKSDVVESADPAEFIAPVTHALG